MADAELALSQPLHPAAISEHDEEVSGDGKR
jgi:hypothetical protein